jgi:hypothetical protein
VLEQLLGVIMCSSNERKSSTIYGVVLNTKM